MNEKQILNRKILEGIVNFTFAREKETYELEAIFHSGSCNRISFFDYKTEKYFKLEYLAEQDRQELANYFEKYAKKHAKNRWRINKLIESIEIFGEVEYTYNLIKFTI